MNLHRGPQPAVSTSVGNSVDIVPLEREVNLNVNKSVELLGNILDDLDCIFGLDLDPIAGSAVCRTAIRFGEDGISTRA